MAGDYSHIPVLLHEVLTALAPKAGDIFLDGTLGRAGHSIAISRHLGATGRIIGVDRDPQALRESEVLLREVDTPFSLIHSSFSGCFSRLPDTLRFDAALLDLGVSSPQLDNPDRGFSFMRDGPLDMRMDPTQGQSAADVIARLPEQELADVIFRYGEERFSRQIAKRIVETRRNAPITTTSMLADVVRSVIRGYSPIDKATRTFQALRIYVNDEVGELERFLDRIGAYMKPGARLAIISFHSLEDRVVKLRFREWQDAGIAQVMTRKPIVAGEVSVAENPRARSAKLRLAVFGVTEQACDAMDEDI